jgi:cytochrome c-type biogenesis protein CcmF
MERDPNKMMAFADVSLLDSAGNPGELLRPAKFIYRTHPNMPTTEVAIRSRAKSDLYVIVSTIDPQSKQATFRIIVRPLVAWIWIGGLLALFGTVVAIWPSTSALLARRSLSPTLAAIFLLVSFLIHPYMARAQDDSSSMHAGTVIMNNDEERSLFGKLLCQCGQCARLALDVCGCDWAEHKRAELRAQLAAGKSTTQILTEYRNQFGSAALSTPSDHGFNRLIWAVPVAGLLLGVAFVWGRGKRWVDMPAQVNAPANNATHEIPASGSANSSTEDLSAYESRIEKMLHDKEREL